LHIIKKGRKIDGTVLTGIVYDDRGAEREHNLNLMNFLSHNDGIVLAYFVSSHLTIVEGAVVLVTIAMN